MNTYTYMNTNFIAKGLFSDKFNKDLYYITITIDDLNYCTDTHISHLLNIDYDNYIALLKDFESIIYHNEEYFFATYQKVLDFANYLNDKYLVMLKLARKV